MSDLVDSTQIEQIVGAKRHPTTHYGRAASVEQVVYILHSQRCLDYGADLRDCDFSKALDRGIDEYEWSEHEDKAVELVIFRGRLVPRIGDA